jgi:transcription antitermination factor NusG
MNWAGAENAVTENAVTLPCLGHSEWFAVHTRSRHEKKVHEALTREGITSFLPLTTQVNQWSDRRVAVQLPLFSCYLFVCIPPNSTARIAVLRTTGVISFVGVQGRGIPVPERQIENLRTLVANNVPLTPHPYLKIGQRVRIRGGCLDGVEGILAQIDGERKVVISVDTIGKSLAVHVKGYEIEPLSGRQVVAVAAMTERLACIQD